MLIMGHGDSDNKYFSNNYAQQQSAKYKCSKVLFRFEEGKRRFGREQSAYTTTLLPSLLD